MRRRYKDLRKHPRRAGKDIRVRKRTWKNSGLGKMLAYLQRH